MTDDSKNPGNDTFYELIVNCPKLSAVYFTDKINPDFSSLTLTMYNEPPYA